MKSHTFLNSKSISIPALLPIVALASLVLSGASVAGLEHKTYVDAENLYKSGEWEKTISKLKDYKDDDSEYLNDNPKILNAINEVIEYCKDKISQKCSNGCVIVSGIKIEGQDKEKPSLPENE